MGKKHLYILFLSLLALNASGQVSISGKVTDGAGAPMPYVNIYLDGSTNGTSTNFDGNYEFEVTGNAEYDIIFQFIGYEKVTEHLVVGSSDMELNVQLGSENVVLPSVTITDDDRDPAYAIIEAAQDMRKYYLKKMESYSSQVYIKGTMRLDEIPEEMPFQILINDEGVDSSLIGLIYVTESVADFYVDGKDNFKEEMLASKVAGWSQGFSWNRAQDVLFNFYENDIRVNISEREFVSPIASDAKLFYRYELEGTIMDNGQQINKIKVIPKQDHYPCFHGHIYIAEDTWHIEGTDLFLTKDANIEWVDTIYFEQSYINVIDDIFMPLSVKIGYQFEVFGFGGSANFNGTFANYEMEKDFPKKFFSNEIFTIEDEANQKGSSYWDLSRPILLTNEEVGTYHEGDSLETHYRSPEYLDSIDRVHNEFKWWSYLLFGYSHQNSFDSVRIDLNSPLSGLQFNTVEGLNLTLSPSFSKRLPNYGRLNIYANVRHGFSSQKFYTSGGMSWRMNAQNYGTLSVNGGSFIWQYNSSNPITPVLNTAYSLSFKDNFMKLYEKTYVSIAYRQELFNGLFGNVEMEWAERGVLPNTTDYTWSKKDEKEYTTNWPYPYPGQPLNALTLEVNLRYRIKQLYETYPDRKRIVGTKYPTLYAGYKKGIALTNEYADYDLVTLGLGDDISFGLLGVSKFDVSVGKFLNNTRMGIYDYVHFNGNQTHIIQNPTAHGFDDDTRLRLSHFHTLDYYTHSTNDIFLEAHYEHHFNGWIFNKLPLLRKTKWQVVAGTNFLLSKGMVLNQSDSVTQDEWLDYTELFVGIENIFKFFRVDLATSYVSGGKIVPQVRLGLDFAF